MVTCTFAGGLGNNIFQLANLLSLSNDYEISSYVSRPTIEHLNNQEKKLELFELFDNNFNWQNVDFSKYHQYTHYDMLPNGSFSYNPVTYVDNTCYNGYFQSEKYFKPNLKNELILNKKITDSCLSEEYFSKKTIALHYRLAGDRVESKMQHFHRNVDVDFYEKALDMIIQNDDVNDYNIILFSDDIFRAREILGNTKYKTFYLSVGHSNVRDFITMSLCDYNILGNSTFSWWAAYLNKKSQKIIAPKSQWFGPGNSHLDLSDLFPKTWITL